MNHSLVDPYAVFFHVLGTMGLVAFAGMEWATLLRLRRDPEPSRVTAALSLLGIGQKLISIGVPILLLSGLYLVHAAWPFTPWVAVGLVSMALLGFLGGGFTGRHVKALMASEGKALATHLPALWTSFVLRASILTATIFVMCAKPGLMGSVATLGIAVVGGMLIARGTGQPAAASADASPSRPSAP